MLLCSMRHDGSGQGYHEPVAVTVARSKCGILMQRNKLKKIQTSPDNFGKQVAQQASQWSVALLAGCNASGNRKDLFTGDCKHPQSVQVRQGVHTGECTEGRDCQLLPL